MKKPEEENEMERPEGEGPAEDSVKEPAEERAEDSEGSADEVAGGEEPDKDNAEEQDEDHADEPDEDHAGDGEDLANEVDDGEKKSSGNDDGNDPDGKGKKEKGKKPGKKLPVWKMVVTLVLLFVFSFLTAAVIWALASWSKITMDELLWHLKVSMKGTNPDMIRSFVTITVGSASAITIVAGLFFLFFRSKQRAKRVINRIFFILSLLILTTGLVSAWFGFGLGPFLKDYFTVSPYIADNYVDPGEVKITFPEKKRNLIVIYLESMEVTYSDKESGGAFPQNVIPDLTELALENESFAGNSGVLNGGVALPGAIWTMGAIFGTTSGLPLKTPLGQNGMSANDDFFPGLVTLGDILSDAGYANLLMMGSGATFGGCRLYYNSHGKFNIHDYYHAINVGRIPEDYYVWWGLEDEKLFDYAREDVLELAKGDKPFQMVIQTMDTHFEDGHYCPQCKRLFGANKYANVMNCSSHMVTEFVRWLQQQDFYENTTIIITGDHPTMDKNFCDNVPEDYLRKTYTCILNSAAEPADPDKVRLFSTFDLFPTTLAAIGAEVEGERLGLGTNLYSGMPTLLEKQGLTEVEEEIGKHSRLMDDMYGGDYISVYYQNKDEE